MVEDVSPRGVFANVVWQTAFAMVLFVIALVAMAAIGPALTISSNPQASASAVGMVPMTIGSTELQVSQLAIFVAFIIFTLVSLAAVGWLISFAVSSLTTNMITSRAGAGATASAPREPETVGVRQALVFLITFTIIFVVLYLLFYYVLIGLILQNPPQLLAFLSIVNALIFTILIMRPMWLVSLLAKVSGWTANVLRGGNRVDGTSKIDRRNQR